MATIQIKNVETEASALNDTDKIPLSQNDNVAKVVTPVKIHQYVKGKADTAPTEGSSNLVTSGGVKTALDAKADESEVSQIAQDVTNLSSQVGALDVVHGVGEVSNGVLCVHEVTDISTETQIMGASASLANVASVEVDGVSVTVAATYQFAATGRHEVRITLAEGVHVLPASLLRAVPTLTEAYVGDQITRIGQYAFYGNAKLWKLVLGAGVEKIDYSPFAANPALEVIYARCKSAPSETTSYSTNASFKYSKIGGTIYYPKGADFSEWKDATDQGMLGYLQWNFVEVPTFQEVFDGMRSANNEVYANMVLQMRGLSYFLENEVSVALTNDAYSVNKDNGAKISTMGFRYSSITVDHSKVYRLTGFIPNTSASFVTYAALAAYDADGAFLFAIALSADANGYYVFPEKVATFAVSQAHSNFAIYTYDPRDFDDLTPIDNCTSSDGSRPLSAKQGKVLDERITSVYNELSGEIADVASLVGLPGVIATAASLNNNRLEITDYPKHTKMGGGVSAKAFFASGAFEEMRVGIGYEYSAGTYVKLTADSVLIQKHYTGSSGVGHDGQTLASFVHGLTLDTFVSVIVKWQLGHWKVAVATKGGDFICEADLPLMEWQGYPFVYASENSTLTNVTLGVANEDFQKPIWWFGDSYTSIFETGNSRWVDIMLRDYKMSDFCLMGLAGGNSDELYLEDLIPALEFGTPKYLVWALGMNDGDNIGSAATAINSNWLEYFERVKDICEAKGITLVGVTIPNTPTIDNTYKNAYLLNSGLRVIKCAEAVGATAFPSNWYDGTHPDNDTTHPNNLGSKLLCAQIFVDMPEFLQYSRRSDTENALAEAHEAQNLVAGNEATVAILNVTDISSATNIFGSSDNFSISKISRMLVDGVEVTPALTYQFAETGVHVVEVIFVDNTTLPNAIFFSVAELVELIVGSGIGTIGSWTFANCQSLRKIVYPRYLRFIGYAAGYFCAHVEEVVCLAKSAPSINANCFQNWASGGVLRVPYGSDYSAWTGSTYLSALNWSVMPIMPTEAEVAALRAKVDLLEARVAALENA